MACTQDRDKLGKLIVKNIKNLSQHTPDPEQENHSSRQEDQHLSQQDENRTDAGYMEWKAWCTRDKNRMETELEQKELAAKKTATWALYRECERLVQENKNNWHERQEGERLRRLEEEEKVKRISEAENKKKKLSSKFSSRKAAAPKKETKLELTRRLEEKKKLEGKLRMRSELWRQRREKDGKLLSVWKEVARKHQEVASEEQETIQQEDTNWLEVTPWLEDRRREAKAVRTRDIVLTNLHTA